MDTITETYRKHFYKLYNDLHEFLNKLTELENTYVKEDMTFGEIEAAKQKALPLVKDHVFSKGDALANFAEAVSITALQIPNMLKKAAGKKKMSEEIIEGILNKLKNKENTEKDDEKAISRFFHTFSLLIQTLIRLVKNNKDTTSQINLLTQLAASSGKKLDGTIDGYLQNIYSAENIINTYVEPKLQPRLAEDNA